MRSRFPALERQYRLGKKLFSFFSHLPPLSLPLFQFFHQPFKLFNRTLSSFDSTNVDKIFPPPPLKSSIPPNAYDIAYEESLVNPSSYWSRAAESLPWMSKSGPALHYNSNDPHDYDWFKNWKMNTCDAALDVQVKNGRGNQIAIIYDSPVTKKIEKFTYKELLERTSKAAGAISSCGVGVGSRVLIYCPMIIESVISMLACARLGAVHSVVFGGFGSTELAKRIKDCEPTVIISASCGIEPNRIVGYKELLDEAIEISGVDVKTVVIVQREQMEAKLKRGRDIEWEEFIKSKGTPTAPVPLNGDHPLYLLYTSGTTGNPKGVVRQSGGHAVAMKWSMENIFAMKPGSVWWAASDLGWVVGHSYIVYAPLLQGLTSILYEGKPIGTPDASAFWRVVSEHKVEGMFAAPTAVRAIKKEDDAGKGIEKYNIRNSSLKRFWVAGERGDVSTIEWGQSKLGVPLLDNYWQTESGFPIIANPVGLHQYKVKPGSATKPLPGYNLHLLTDDGQRITQPRVEGNLVLKYPLPPCCLTTLYNAHDRYLNSYTRRFPSYYDTSDSGYIDDDGYVYIMTRTDDVMNVAGHRLSSGTMEEAVGGVNGVAECAVVGLADQLKGQVPVAFVVVRSGEKGSKNEIAKKIVAAVRHSVGPVASLKDVIFVARLPKTRSGKILRATIRQLGDDLPVKIPPTIEDETVIGEIKETIDNARIGKGKIEEKPKS